MLDIKRIRSNPEEVQSLLNRRGKNISLDSVIKLDKEKRGLLMKVEEMKSEQNSVSKKIPGMKKLNLDTTEILAEMKKLSKEIKQLDSEIKSIDEKLNIELLKLPNTPQTDVTIGQSDKDNKLIRSCGEIRQFDFDIKPHWDLGTDLDILDFERASKISGPRFAIFKGMGARLERAIIQYMLDTHTMKHSFTEVMTPLMVNSNSMYGTGQLPKFEEEMYKISNSDYYMIPTAEVSVTNMYRDEILDEKDLPVYMTSYTPCFRREASSAGKDNRGLIRNHQFDKVEMVMYTRPEHSYEQLEILTGFAEEILKGLKLPYRVVELCTADLGFSASKTYDIEVWMPSYNKYVEISSCSNFEDFQARRLNLKFRPEKGKSLEFVHTLNGSGLAVGRTFAAILENYQLEGGTIEIPEVLRPYMMDLEKINY